ncbi:MAG TPA: NUDIX domain-containing protein [Chloroflexota bacterium]|nr:NUDIX domain-containing protein [Chloroflexota bacterium]
MIRDLLVRLLVFPWPAPLRRILEHLAMSNAVQRFFVPHFKVGVVGVITNDLGDILLLQHVYRHEYPWGFPSGFMEPGEQPDAALVREIREEVGLEVRLRGVWRVYADTRRALLNVVYRGEAVAGSLSPHGEISAAGYFGSDALPPLIPDQRELYEAARREAAAEAARVGS